MARDVAQYVIGRVRDALATHPDVGELGLEVTVSGTKIFVSGPVATAERRGAITHVLNEVFPEYDIHNETSVSEMGDVDEAEELT